MTTIFLGRDAYSRSASSMPEILCKNQFAESAPTSETGLALLPRPALKPFATAGAGPCRGFFREAGTVDGNFVSVSGGAAYVITADGTVSLLGAVFGSNRVDIAGSAGYLIIADEEGGGYYYDGATFATIAFPDGAGISTVDFIDGYFVLGRLGSRRFYWTGVASVTVNPLDYASKERTADNIVCIRATSDEVWIFGETSIEVWVPTGDGNLPFQRVNGRMFSRGCISRDTVAKLDNTFFWVGNDRIVYRGGASVPTPISTNSISDRLRRVDAADVRGWAFTWIGHVFYALTIGDEGTFCFDVSTGQWCEFGSYGLDGWRAHLGAANTSLILAGDAFSGQVWELADNVVVDGVNSRIIYEVTGQILVAGQRAPINNFAIDIAVGTAAIGVKDHFAEMRYSDDAGRTWSDWDAESLGEIGDYSWRVRWRRLGQTQPPGRIFHVRISSPVRYRLSKAMYNERYP